MEVFAAELETISTLAEERHTITKFLLMAAAMEIFCLKSAHHFITRSIFRGPKRVKKMDRQNVFILFSWMRKANSSCRRHETQIAIAEDSKGPRHLGENAQCSTPGTAHSFG
jgi:hypothetical protein